ncbi:MAG: hypothetical protein ABII93_05275 [Chrysiogenia bacterium]
MNKALLMASLLVFAMGMIHGATITVTQPDGSDVSMGSACQIKWTASNVNSNVKILLRRPGGALVGTIVNNLPVSPGLYSWTVAAPAVVGENYKIHVRATDGSAEGASAVFTVKAAAPPPPPPPPSCTLKLDSPNGGESWVRGSEQTISWTSTNLDGKVRLELVRYQGPMLGIIAENLPASGSYQWKKAGEYSGNTAPPGKYLIRVRSMAKFECFDEGDAPFNLILLAVHLKKPLLAPITKQAIILNWMGKTTFPKKIIGVIDLEVYQARPICDAGYNKLALVGAEWFQYQSNISAARLQRSKLVFPLHDLLGKGAELKQATLKLKRVSCVCNGEIRVASCVFNIEVLQGPWSNFFSTPGYWIGGLGGSGNDFSKDVTETVRKWLDGSEDYHHGFLLIGDELPTSKSFACFSCFEPTLVLTMK